MPKPTKGPRLGSGPTHERMMLGGLASQLILHERIRTTETKAKRLRPVADRLVTLGKQGSVHARRRALSMIEDREIIHKLFADLAPRFADRSGGYTRVLKLGPRQGDAAPMAIIEFVDGSDTAGPQAQAEQKRRRGLRRRKAAKPAAEGGQAAEPPKEQIQADSEEEPGVMQGAESDGALDDASEPGTLAPGEPEGSGLETSEAEVPPGAGESATEADEPPSDQKS